MGKNTVPYPETELSYLGNVSNRLAKEFYTQHGLGVIQDAFELKQAGGEALMFTKHCLKYSLGLCPKDPNRKEGEFAKAYQLRYKDVLLDLEFDCTNCEMLIYRK